MRLVDGSFFKLAGDVQWAFRTGKAWAEDHDDRFVRLVEPLAQCVTR